MLASLLVWCRDKEIRDLQRAFELSQRVVELNPQYWYGWSLVGITKYRTGDFRGARSALETAKQHKYLKEYDGFELFFLVMAHWQLGEKDEAR